VCRRAGSGQSINGGVGYSAVRVNHDNNIWRVGREVAQTEVQCKSFPYSCGIVAFDNFSLCRCCHGRRIICAIIRHDEQAIAITYLGPEVGKGIEQMRAFVVCRDQHGNAQMRSAALRDGKVPLGEGYAGYNLYYENDDRNGEETSQRYQDE
jgi:hypothetical protein